MATKSTAKQHIRKKTDFKKNLISISYVRRLARPVLMKYPIRRTFVFGSFSRGDTNKNSDVDLLVEFTKPISLFTLIGLQRELKKSIGVPVDVVSRYGVRPRFMDYIKDDLRLIYESRR